MAQTTWRAARRWWFRRGPGGLTAAIGLVAAVIASPAARGQCYPYWTPGESLNGPREGHAAVYDRDRGCIVLFGGAGPGGVLMGDTLERAGGPWMLRATTGPGARTGHAMAYDAARHQTVLFGGFAAGVLGDTWTWDGAAWTKHELPGPSPRQAHAMAYDLHRERVVLFGGESGETRFDDTWEWDGGEWTRIEVAGPPGQSGHAMAYDEQRRRVVALGRLDPESVQGRTWTWDGVEWRLATLMTQAAIGSRMAYHEDYAQVIRFGGVTSFGGPATGTFAWDGQLWRSVQVAGEPAPRTGHAVVYDPASESVIVAGGRDAAGPRSDVTGFTYFGPPRFIENPVGLTVPPGRTAEFTVVAEAPAAVTYQWYRFATRLRDGPRISGATTPHLTILDVQAGDAGAYNCLATTACVADYSLPATLTVACLADFTGDGLVDFSDYLEFLNAYEAQDTRADLGGDGLIDFSDYLEFLNLYEIGC